MLLRVFFSSIKGEYESTKADLNAIISPLLPPIMPTGQFKFSFELIETKLNETIFKADVELISKQTAEFRAMDFNFKWLCDVCISRQNNVYFFLKI